MMEKLVQLRADLFLFTLKNSVKYFRCHTFWDGHPFIFLFAG
jgi:hypothetical protein